MKLANNLYGYPEQGMMDCNTYVIAGGPGIIVDPGNPAYLNVKVAGMKEDGIDIKNIGLIVNTHLHIDHSAANEAFKALSGARIALHPVQKRNYQMVVVDGTRLFGEEPAEFKEDLLLGESRLSFGGIDLELIPAPGHSPDCVCYYWREPKVLFCGDVLFQMNTGRVDLPGGSADDLKISIEALSRLDIELLLPGHMGGVAGADGVKRNFEHIRNNVFPWL
ncbi:MAG: MBL fold metallo-hydrolase [Dehalococcoidales bacterium]|jgi:glyoxylase-like metal-dependent hydrolase (beta-lactamase superfamily II)